MALLVGTGLYDDPRIPPLRSPAADVEGMHDALSAANIGAFQDVATLANPTNAELRKRIAKFFANRRRGDLVVLYFSGHGMLDRNGQLYLAARDTDPDVLSATGVAASFVAELMDDCSSRRQILILDCCYSGAFERGTKSISVGPDQTARAFTGNGFGRVILTASTPTQRAAEGERVGLSTDRSAFTHFLVEGLRSGRADLDKDGLISIDEIYQFAHDAMVDHGAGQTPMKSARQVQGRLIVALAGAKCSVVPNAIASERTEAPSRRRIPVPSRRTVLIVVGAAIALAVGGTEFRRRAALRTAYANFGMALGHYTVRARDYLRIYNEAARPAIAAAIAHLDSPREVPDNGAAKPAAEVRLDRITPEYNRAFDDLTFSRERHYETIARFALPGSDVPKLVSRAEAVAIDAVHHGNIERLNNITKQIKALETCATRRSCKVDEARSTADGIERQLDDIRRGAEAGLSEVERIHVELSRSIFGTEG